MSRMSDRFDTAVHDWILGHRFDAIRSAVIREATGRVLEIGAGTGLNFASYAPGTHVTAIEPARALRARAIERSRGAGIRADVEVVDAFAEHLPFEPESFDHVVVTFVLCSVRDVGGALGEIHRVLRPGGSLLLAEHVVSPEPRTARCQRRAQPVWEHLFSGCSLVRDTRADLERAGFDASGVSAIVLPLPRIARAGIIGSALRV